MAQIDCPKCGTANVIDFAFSGHLECSKCGQGMEVVAPKVDVTAGRMPATVRHAVKLGSADATARKLDAGAFGVKLAFAITGIIFIVVGLDDSPALVVHGAALIAFGFFCGYLLRGLADLLRQAYALRADVKSLRTGKGDGDV